MFLTSLILLIIIKFEFCYEYDSLQSQSCSLCMIPVTCNIKNKLDFHVACQYVLYYKEIHKK